MAMESSAVPMLRSVAKENPRQCPRTGNAYADRAADCFLRDTKNSLSSLQNLHHSGPVMFGCLGSIISISIQKALRDPKTGCDHPVVYLGTCLACKDSIGDLFGDRFDYLEKGLRVSRVARETLRKMVTRRLLGVRKLHLVLDLDHTLLQSIHPSELSPGEEHLKTLADVSEITGDLFFDEKDERITKLRPFVRSFLKEASSMFELTVYTKASRSYAKNMVSLLDPDRCYFGNRVIVKEDSTNPRKKSLDIVLAEPSCTLILDDKKIWPRHTRNLILAERYNYFASKQRTQRRDLHPKKPGQHDDGNYLLNALDVLKSVHKLYFNLWDSGHRSKKPGEQNYLWNVLDVLKSVHRHYFNLVDVRSQLATIRGDILKDCQILILAGASSTMKKAMRMAWESGAVLHSKRCSSVTHVISKKTDADHSRWALEQNKFLVHPDWVSAAYLQWRRPPEHEFPAKLGTYIDSCLRSIVAKSIQKASRDPEVGCEHPILCGETCLACQAIVGDSDWSGVRLDYVKPEISVSCKEAGKLRQRISRNLVESRKLHLILGLYNTLLHTIKSFKLNPDEEHLKTLAEHYSLFGTIGETTGDLFIDDYGLAVTKLRPFVRSFLKEASAMFELTVYTMGSRVHAQIIVDLIDPDRSYFGNRVITKEDSTNPKSKSLDVVLADPSCTLILDNTYIWPDHTRNLILAERYNHFGKKKSGEHDGSSYLENVLGVLKSVHQGYFNLYDCGDRGAADVRSQLTTLRGNVLKDCQILIPSCFDREIRMARELGAVVRSTRCLSVTHVVSKQPGADHSRWALEQNKFLVHPEWVFSAFQRWRRPPELEFPPSSANRV